MKTDEQVLKDARQRGYDRGLADKKEGTHRDGILSGEWAGDSITELLGDLISRTDEDGEQWVCDEYVAGYEEANEPDEKLYWGDLANITTHARQVELFEFCTCEDNEGNENPFDDCPTK